MNIFALDNDPLIAAKYHADIHLNKMILESAQMLSTAAAILINGGQQLPNLYKPTHINHPCNIWLRRSPHNVQWLTYLAIHLDFERKFRYKTSLSHKSIHVIWIAYTRLLKHFKILEADAHSYLHTPFAEAVPDEIKPLKISAVEKYHLTYQHKRDHGMQMVWTNREVPPFM